MTVVAVLTPSQLSAAAVRRPHSHFLTRLCPSNLVHLQLRSLDISGTAAADCLLLWLALRCCGRLTRLVLSNSRCTGLGLAALLRAKRALLHSQRCPAVSVDMADAGKAAGASTTGTGGGGACPAVLPLLELVAAGPAALAPAPEQLVLTHAELREVQVGGRGLCRGRLYDPRQAAPAAPLPACLGMRRLRRARRSMRCHAASQLQLLAPRQQQACSPLLRRRCRAGGRLRWAGTCSCTPPPHPAARHRSRCPSACSGRPLRPPARPASPATQLQRLLGQGLALMPMVAVSGRLAALLVCWHRWERPAWGSCRAWTRAAHRGLQRSLSWRPPTAGERPSSGTLSLLHSHSDDA